MRLTLEEKAALKHYSGSGYATINSALRFGEEMDESTQATIQHLDSAIAKSRNRRKLILHRGVDEAYARALKKQGLLPGQRLVDAGFLSTSTRQDIARRFLGWEGGGMLLKIHVPAGSNALALRPYSKNPEEHEILLPRDARLRVIGYDPKADALELEVV